MLDALPVLAPGDGIPAEVPARMEAYGQLCATDQTSVPKYPLLDGLPCFHKKAFCWPCRGWQRATSVTV